MAGSFRHMTRDGYKPYDENFGLGSMLENGGDTVEALQKCYGMIWYLADQLARKNFPGVKNPKRQTVQQFIAEAEQNAKEGLERGKSGD